MASPPALVKQTQELADRLDRMAPVSSDEEAKRATESSGSSAEVTPPSPMPLADGALSCQLDRHRCQAVLRKLMALAQGPAGEFLCTGRLSEVYQQTVSMAELLQQTVSMLSESSEAGRRRQGITAWLDFLEQRTAAIQASVEQHIRQSERLTTLAHCYEDLIALRPARMEWIAELADVLVREAGHGRPIYWFREPIQEPARWAAAHGLNTAQVMARVARHQPQWQTRLRDAVRAALLFDVGMAAVPPDILFQTRSLDPTEQSLIEVHVGRSAEVVDRALADEGWLADAIRRHHERCDGSGYPDGLRGNEIPALARLLAVCDTYAALRSSRPHRPAQPPRTAMTETLLEVDRGRLDANAAEALLALGFYPAGTGVELSDGRVGVVVANHDPARDVSLMARPVVYVLVEADGSSPPAMTWVDLAEADSCHIVRSRDGDHWVDRPFRPVASNSS